MAGLGSLPDTILTRSVIIRMRKKAPNEKCQPYRRRVHEKQGHVLRYRLADWTATLHDQVAEAWPEMPEGSPTGRPTYGSRSSRSRTPLADTGPRGPARRASNSSRPRAAMTKPPSEYGC